MADFVALSFIERKNLSPPTKNIHLLPRGSASQLREEEKKIPRHFVGGFFITASYSSLMSRHRDEQTLHVVRELSDGYTCVAIQCGASKRRPEHQSKA